MPNNLDKLMTERNLSARALARELGMAADAPASWRRGKHKPQPHHRRNAAAFFGVDADWLFAEADTEQQPA